jgi:5'-methylthioadenosine phosphorylase
MDAEIGVVGGSRFYSLFDSVEERSVETPYGPTSAPVAIGEIYGKTVAFIPRHGREHELPPHRIPYRANVWAMREVGVRRIVGPCVGGAARGSRPRRVRRLRPVRRPNHLEAAGELGVPVRDGGTVVVVQGPRFSTRAESRWYRDLGGDVINMTAL